MYAYDCRTLLCAHVKIVLYLIVIILPWKIFIIFSLGFDLPVGSKILISGTQILTTAKENKNFIVKAAESFSNTVSIWIQRAGEILSSTLEFPFFQKYSRSLIQFNWLELKYFHLCREFRLTLPNIILNFFTLHYVHLLWRWSNPRKSAIGILQICWKVGIRSWRRVQSCCRWRWVRCSHHLHPHSLLATPHFLVINRNCHYLRNILYFSGRSVGARILLGDRDVDVTLSRLATAVSDSSPERWDIIRFSLSFILAYLVGAFVVF